MTGYGPSSHTARRAPHGDKSTLKHTSPRGKTIWDAASYLSFPPPTLSDLTLSRSFYGDTEASRASNEQSFAYFCARQPLAPTVRCARIEKRQHDTKRSTNAVSGSVGERSSACYFYCARRPLTPFFGDQFGAMQT